MSGQTWRVPNDPRFAETEYVVSATYEEKFGLWFRWSEHCKIPWEQDRAGWSTTIGEVAGRAIVVAVYWAIIGPARVAFVELTSALADYTMMERWESHVFRCLEQFGRHSDAANFGHVLKGIEERHRVKLGLLGDMGRRVDRFWQIDSHEPYAEVSDPQQAYEWAEAKSVQWAECAAYWRKRIEDGCSD